MIVFKVRLDLFEYVFVWMIKIVVYIINCFWKIVYFVMNINGSVLGILEEFVFEVVFEICYIDFYGMLKVIYFIFEYLLLIWINWCWFDSNLIFILRMLLKSLSDVFFLK